MWNYSHRSHTEYYGVHSNSRIFWKCTNRRKFQQLSLLQVYQGIFFKKSLVIILYPQFKLCILIHSCSCITIIILNWLLLGYSNHLLETNRICDKDTNFHIFYAIFGGPSEMLKRMRLENSSDVSIIISHSDCDKLGRLLV